MASIKVYALGGLDQKSNDLTRDPDKATAMMNLEYDTQSTIKKRTGYDLIFNKASNDLIYYQYKDEKLFFTNNSNILSVVDAANNTKNLTMPSTILNADISSTENQNNIYFTSTDLLIPVMKYDGSNVYRSGLPAPRQEGNAKPTFSSTSGGYTRIFYSFKDINGNVTYSPYFQSADDGSEGVTGSTVIGINSFKTSSTLTEQGFLYRYAWYFSTSTSVPSVTINNTNATLNNISNNYVAGDYFLFEIDVVDNINTNRILLSTVSSLTTASGKSFVKWKISSATSTSITFDTYSMGNDSVTLPAVSGLNAKYPVDLRTKLHIATSSKKDYGYYMLGSSTGAYILLDDTLTNSQQFSQLFEWKPVNAKGYTKTAFENLYDSTTYKIMPPYCRYLASYGNQIIHGNIGKYFNSDNSEVAYDNDDLIIFTDSSAGDGPEGNSPINFQKIGETWDGKITGMRRCNDSFIIFKNHGVFSIDGALYPSEYQLRKINSNYVGCTSHKSILDTEDGVYFQAHNGLYYTNGVSLKKVSYELDPFFGSYDYNLTRSVRFKQKQKALFYINASGFSNQQIVVVDYYYQQVYFWNNIPASSGFIEDANGNVFFTDSTNVFKFNLTTFNDNGFPVGGSGGAYYSTTYHHCGEASLRKKFKQIRLFALTNDVFDLTIYHDMDWAGNTAQNKHLLSFATTDQTKLLVHDMQTCKSLRYTFSNATTDQPMVITGYEIEYEPWNKSDKD
jgi:hypothetical protein